MKISSKDGKAGKIHISVDGEYYMTVDGQFWFSLGIPDGTQVSCDELEQLRQSIGERRAFNKGAELLSLREHCRAELIRKLKDKGYGEYASQAVDRLQEYGYIDDRRFADILARQLSENKHMGAKRIYMELCKRGVDRETAADAVGELECEPVEQITELLNGKLSRYLVDDKGIKKCYNTLIRLGYCPSDIRRALSALDE